MLCNRATFIATVLFVVACGFSAVGIAGPCLFCDKDCVNIPAAGCSTSAGDCKWRSQGSSCNWCNGSNTNAETACIYRPDYNCDTAAQLEYECGTRFVGTCGASGCVVPPFTPGSGTCTFPGDCIIP